MWYEATSIPDRHSLPHVAEYLKSRGITLPVPPVLGDGIVVNSWPPSNSSTARSPQFTTSTRVTARRRDTPPAR